MLSRNDILVEMNNTFGSFPSLYSSLLTECINNNLYEYTVISCGSVYIEVGDILVGQYLNEKFITISLLRKVISVSLGKDYVEFSVIDYIDDTKTTRSDLLSNSDLILLFRKYDK